MILAKETYEKFGYWPHEYSKKSPKPILYSCDLCKITNRCSLYNYYFPRVKDLKACKKCYFKIMLEKAHQAHEIRLKNDWKNENIFKEITPDFFFILYNSSSLYKYRNYKRGMKINMRVSRKSISREDTIAIFKGLGLKFIPENTSIYRKHLIEFYNKQSKLFKLSVVSKILGNFKTDYRFLKIRTNASYKKYGVFFNSDLGFLAKPSSSCSYHKKLSTSITIAKGSFFIEGRWHHVG